MAADCPRWKRSRPVAFKSAVEGEPRLAWCGDACLVVEFGDAIDPLVNSRVRSLGVKLEGLAPPWLVETVPTYRSLAVYVDPWGSHHEEIERFVASLAKSMEAATLPPSETVLVPVCYGGHYGPDLERISGHTALEPDEIIRLHSRGLYRVFMMGFTPGFPYLGGLDPALETPRLESPRSLVPSGSVGIAGKQTGIYSIDSPGGWNIIGRTPLSLFDPGRKFPFLIEAGMDLKFVPITSAEFEEIARGERGVEP